MLSLLRFAQVLKDNHRLSEVKRELRDSTQKIADEKARMQELEISLATEEAALDKIRDSLKGLGSHPLHIDDLK